MRLVLCVIFGCLLFAAPAMAAPNNQYTLADAGGGNVQVTAGDLPTVAISYTATCIMTGVCNDALIVSSADAGTTFDNTSGCAEVTGAGGVSFKCALPARLAVIGKGGDDSVTGVCDGGRNVPLDFTGGGGADEVSAPTCSGSVVNMGDGNDRALASGTIAGGAGNDVLRGGPGRDVLDGGPGNDLLIGGPGADTMIGGSGVDTASFEDKTVGQPVTVTIDDQPNDGQTGGDNVRTDVENVIGGDAGDTIIGTAGSNVLQGGDGGDVIDGGAGNDRILARDGFQDRVTCGDGNDVAVVDGFDSVDGCESVDSSRALMPDVDGDGVTAPTDCDDHNARRRPGLRDVPGNGIDEDCTGSDAPFARVLTSVQNVFSAGSVTRFMVLKLRGVPEHARAELRCSGGRKKGCFSGVKRFRYPKGKDTANIRSAVRRTRFRPGSRLEIRVLAPESIGKVVRFTIRRNKAPKQAVLCLAPGRKKPGRC